MLTIVRQRREQSRARHEEHARAALVQRQLDRGLSLADAMLRTRMRGGSTSVAWTCRNTPAAFATGAKTALVAASPSQSGLAIVEFGVSFNGVTATDAPALVELCQLTLGAAGTAGGSPPAGVQIRGRAGNTAPTVTHNYTAEPTTVTPMKHWYVSPNGGLLVIQFPLGREPECDASGGTVKALSIRVNTAASVSVAAYMEIESAG